MKLRNKKTGEILELCCHRSGDYREKYDSLAELNKEWCDVEPKTHWYIYGAEPLEVDDGNWDEEFINELKITGNYFETKEEAEKAVEKLKAWKRLKDKGIKIGKRRHSAYGGEMYWDCPNGTGISDKQIWLDLDLLFGGEE